MAGLDELLDQDRQRRFEPRHAKGGRLEGDFLLVDHVRRVVGRDAVDDAVAQAVDQCLPIVVAGQRRIHLEVAAERAH